MKTLFSALSLVAVAVAALALAAPAQAAPNQCFRMSDTGGWRATPDARTMYMRVRIHDIYEVRLRGACPALNRIGVHLVHKVFSDNVCSPLDFDLRVADNDSRMPAISCLVDGFRLMSPEEAAALPPKLRP